MLAEHVDRFLLQGRYNLDTLGRLAFPLFAFALCFNLARSDRVGQSIRRLLVFGVLTQIWYQSLQDHFVLNVLFTFALPLLSVHAIQRWGWFGLPVAVGAAAAAWFAEFWVIGYFLVIALYAWARRPTLPLWATFGVLVALLCLLNGNGYALGAIAVVYLVSLLQVQLPRIRGVFYWIYLAHFALIAGLASLQN